MSLILEALRKSEAERRLGSAPDVLTPMPVMHAPAPRRRWPVLVACVSMLVAGTAWVWWSLHATPPPAQTVFVAQPTKVAADVVSAVNAVPIQEESVKQALVHRIPAVRLQATLPPTLPLPVASMRPAETQVAGPKTTSQRSSKPSGSPSTTKTEAARAAAPAEASPQPTPAPAPVPVAATDEPALMSISELPASERVALPALKVTMHVYADNPTQRFMIVDGQRVGEGTSLGEGVAIVRIRHNGAEIEAHGRRLLLPNP